jgi:hypothetical protein
MFGDFADLGLEPMTSSELLSQIRICNQLLEPVAEPAEERRLSIKQHCSTLISVCSRGAH